MYPRAHHDRSTPVTLSSADAPASASVDGPTILVVDDNPSVTRALSALLRHAGYTASVFNAGLAALEYARKYPPAAAVVDIHLPDVSGLILARELRQCLGDATPIIVVSGDTSMENLNSLKLAGATYFFSKPLRPAQLLERLAEWFG
jgi:DNA-binding response OmpR family regulator